MIDPGHNRADKNLQKRHGDHGRRGNFSRRREEDPQGSSRKENIIWIGVSDVAVPIPGDNANGIPSLPWSWLEKAFIDLSRGKSNYRRFRAKFFFGLGHSRRLLAAR